MRHNEPFVYVIDRLPEVQPIFQFIAEHGPVDEREMYGNYNMGAGFALYVDEADVDQVLAISRRCGIEATRAGYVDKQGDDRRVEIMPLGITYNAEEMNLKA